MSIKDIALLIEITIYLIVVMTTLGLIEENLRLNLKLSKYKVLTVLRTILKVIILFYIGLILLIVDEKADFLKVFICYDLITYIFLRIKRLETTRIKE